jgi:hypothetical protein
MAKEEEEPLSPLMSDPEDEPPLADEPVTEEEEVEEPPYEGREPEDDEINSYMPNVPEVDVHPISRMDLTSPEVDTQPIDLINPDPPLQALRSELEARVEVQAARPALLSVAERHRRKPVQPSVYDLTADESSQEVEDITELKKVRLRQDVRSAGSSMTSPAIDKGVVALSSVAIAIATEEAKRIAKEAAKDADIKAAASEANLKEKKKELELKGGREVEFGDRYEAPDFKPADLEEKKKPPTSDDSKRAPVEPSPYEGRQPEEEEDTTEIPYGKIITSLVARCPSVDAIEEAMNALDNLDHPGLSDLEWHQAKAGEKLRHLKVKRPIRFRHIEAIYRNWTKAEPIEVEEEEKKKDPLSFANPMKAKDKLVNAMFTPLSGDIATELAAALRIIRDELVSSRRSQKSPVKLATMPISTATEALLRTVAVYCTYWVCGSGDFMTLAAMALVATALETSDFYLDTNAAMAFYLSMGEAYAMNSSLLGAPSALDKLIESHDLAFATEKEQRDWPLLVFQWMVHGSPVSLVNARTVLLPRVLDGAARIRGYGTHVQAGQSWWAEGLICRLPKGSLTWHSSMRSWDFPKRDPTWPRLPYTGSDVLLRAPIGFRYTVMSDAVATDCLYPMLTAIDLKAPLTNPVFELLWYNASYAPLVSILYTIPGVGKSRLPPIRTDVRQPRPLKTVDDPILESMRYLQVIKRPVEKKYTK